MNDEDQFKRGLGVGLTLVAMLALCKAIAQATPETLDVLKEEAKRAEALMDQLIRELK